MKPICVLLGLILCSFFATTVQAQDTAFIGTWKLNTAKSKYPAGKMPKSLTRTVEAEGSGAKYHSEGEGADGSKLDFSFSSKYDGTESKVEGTGMPFGADSLIIKRIDAHRTTATLKKDGKVVAHTTGVVSPDGKTTTLVVKPVDGTAARTSVYDKQ